MEQRCPFTGRNEGFSGRKWGHGIVLSCLRFRNPLSVRGREGEGRDIDGGKTIGHWHVINAIYARTISWTGTVVFVLPACAPFIKRGEN